MNLGRNLLNGGQHNYTYDAENRIVSVDNGQTAIYTYEGDGQRIRKVSGTMVLPKWRDVAFKLAFLAVAGQLFLFAIFWTRIGADYALFANWARFVYPSFSS